MKPAKLVSIVFTPWRKYSDYFDKNCWGIWGLSSLLKFTLLSFFIFFIPPIIGLASFEGNSSSSFDYGLLLFFWLMLVAFIWIIYLPILSIITLSRALKKVKHAANMLNTTLNEAPWEMTPKKLYTKPHMNITIAALYLKDYVIDILDWTTQYYPISLLSTSPARYPISMKVRHIARLFESRIAQLNIPLKYVDFEINQQFTLYKFGLYEDVKDFTKVVKKLKKGFKYNYGFYLRAENSQIHIIVPHKLE